MTETLTTSDDGRYRVRLVQDTDCPNPRQNYDHLTNVITPTQRQWPDIDEDGGPLQYGWDYFAPRALDCLRRADAEDLFVRWAKAVHGATVIVDRPSDGPWALWYVMPDKAAESGVTPVEIIEADITEYRTWARGEVYGYVIEELTVWTREGTGETRETWEPVDDGSCFGYIGYDWAKKSAEEEFAAFIESTA